MDRFIYYIRVLWLGILLLLMAICVVGAILMLVDCARILTKF